MPSSLSRNVRTVIPPFLGERAWMAKPCIGLASKEHPCRTLILFPQCSITLLAPHIKKLETYFSMFIFLDFRTVWWVEINTCLHTEFLWKPKLYYLHPLLDMGSLKSLTKEEGNHSIHHHEVIVFWSGWHTNINFGKFERKGKKRSKFSISHK